MLKTLLLLLGGAKAGKALLTSGTMLLSIATYALFWGWPFAVGFVVLIFLHEMGHYVAARQRGLDVGAPTFIPFVGAWVELKKLPHNAETEAYVGLAGPVAGTAASLLCYEVGRYLDSQLLIALSYAGFMLNLFNLLPLAPLDGGRVTQVISPKLWLVGAPLLVTLFFWQPSPMYLLIALLALPSLWQAITGRGPPPAYYDTPPQTRFNYGAAYVGLIAYLGAMTWSLHEQLGGIRAAG
jgi:Zn-dependent protease